MANLGPKFFFRHTKWSDESLTFSRGRCGVLTAIYAPICLLEPMLQAYLMFPIPFGFFFSREETSMYGCVCVCMRAQCMATNHEFPNMKISYDKTTQWKDDGTTFDCNCVLKWFYFRVPANGEFSVGALENRPTYNRLRMIWIHT